PGHENSGESDRVTHVDGSRASARHTPTRTRSKAISGLSAVGKLSREVGSPRDAHDNASVRPYRPAWEAAAGAPMARRGACTDGRLLHTHPRPRGRRVIGLTPKGGRSRGRLHAGAGWSC